jgi:hypothetical protein
MVLDQKFEHLSDRLKGHDRQGDVEVCDGIAN